MHNTALFNDAIGVVLGLEWSKEATNLSLPPLDQVGLMQ